MNDRLAISSSCSIALPEALNSSLEGLCKETTSAFSTTSNTGKLLSMTPQLKDLFDPALLSTSDLQLFSPDTLFSPEALFSAVGTPFADYLDTPLIEPDALIDAFQTPIIHSDDIYLFPTLETKIMPPPQKKRAPPTPAASTEGTTPILDERSLKRQRNTEAARKSRARKVARLQGLAQRVEELEKENQKQHTRIAVLENEKEGWMQREREHQAKIEWLERTLLEKSSQS